MNYFSRHALHVCRAVVFYRVGSHLHFFCAEFNTPLKTVHLSWLICLVLFREWVSDQPFAHFCSGISKTKIGDLIMLCFIVHCHMTLCPTTGGPLLTSTVNQSGWLASAYICLNSCLMDGHVWPQPWSVLVVSHECKLSVLTRLCLAHWHQPVQGLDPSH